MEKIITPVNPGTLPEGQPTPSPQQPQTSVPATPQAAYTNQASSLIFQDADSAIQPAANATQASTTNTKPQAVISASQMGLDTSKRTAQAGNGKKKIIILALTLLLITGVFLFAKNAVTGFTRRTLVNEGYSYTFNYYRAAQETVLGDGKTHVLKYQNSSIMGVKPDTGKLLKECPNAQSTEVARITLYGNEVPICEVGDKFFIVNFVVDGHTQLATLSYEQEQTSDAYPEIKNILSSVTVQKQ